MRTKAFYVVAVCLVAVALACTMPVNTISPTPTPTKTTATSLVAATKPPKTTTRTATVIAYQSLHVRAARGTQAIVIDYLYHGDTVTLTGQCDDGWAEIVWKDGTAWVNADFLSKNKCSEEQ